MRRRLSLQVFFITPDKGACGLQGTRASLDPIVISHWGLMGPFSRMSAHGKFPRFFSNASHVARDMSAGQFCHAPHKDIVVPPFVTGKAPSPKPTRGKGKGKGGGGEGNRTINFARPISIELVHAGGIWGWMNRGPHKPSAYSLGMRQEIFLQWGAERGAPHGLMVVNRSLPDTTWSRSRFCLAPAGDGWGIRMGKAAALNCLPLIAQPFVTQPFEDVRPARFERATSADPAAH